MCRSFRLDGAAAGIELWRGSFYSGSFEGGTEATYIGNQSGCRRPFFSLGSSSGTNRSSQPVEKDCQHECSCPLPATGGKSSVAITFEHPIAGCTNGSAASSSIFARSLLCWYPRRDALALRAFHLVCDTTALEGSRGHGHRCSRFTWTVRLLR